ncbi:hypothetical protein F5Y00DRAFT_273117 [Daldinia vernicosa]|uniref:uncharacterized protein n=1 Tax=Daldinia vernicosa TaxID=114800 RepID=UPI00200856C9|nr:uncharacterized protein F5Y00DRAFT_273117 [Daldinia vernicosa]KAI0852503.1 hypothetical protein F5Y00DRAFT_273117 [Daldinia vernicosa]
MDIADFTEPLTRVTIYCSRCRTALYMSTNLWNRIDEGYITPVASPKFGVSTCVAQGGFPTILLRGPIRFGRGYTVLANCHLQDISCFGCRAVIGFGCLQAPERHVLKDGQLFFRPSSIMLIQADGYDTNPYTGMIVGPIIQKTLSMEEPPHAYHDTPTTPSSSGRSTHAGMSNGDNSTIQGQVPNHLQAQIDASREEIQRLNRSSNPNASSSPSSSGIATPRAQDEVRDTVVQDEIAQLKKDVGELKDLVVEKSSRDAATQDSITSLRNEFSEISLTSARIEQELFSARQVNACILSALSTSRHGSTSTTEQPPQQGLGRAGERPNGTNGVVNGDVSTAKAWAEEISLLRAEINGIKEELAQKRSQESLPEDAGSPAELTNGSTQH